MELQRVSEIESLIAGGEITAAQVFTQMKQLVYRDAPCRAFCEKTAFEKKIAGLQIELFNCYYAEASRQGAGHHQSREYAKKRVDGV